MVQIFGPFALGAENASTDVIGWLQNSGELGLRGVR